MLVPSESKAPSAAQVYEGRDGSGAAVGTNRVITNKSISKNGKITQEFKGLESDKSYVFYAILRSGSTNYGPKNRSISTKKPSIPSATLTSLSVSSDVSGTVTMPTFSPSTKNYDVTVPYGTKNVTINANTGSGVSMMYSDNGSSYDTETSFAVSGSIENKIYVKAFGSGMNDTIYTLNITVKGNTDKGDVKVAESILSSGGGSEFTVPAGTTSANVTITSADSSATVVCSQLGSKSGTGSLSGTISLTSGENIIKYTIVSNRDEAEYSFTITIAD